MANIFQTKTEQNIGTTLTALAGYTVPTGQVATVIGLTIANKSASNVSVSIAYGSNTANTFIVKDVEVPGNSSLVPIGGDQKIVLNEGSTLNVSSNVGDTCDAVMSLLLQT